MYGFISNESYKAVVRKRRPARRGEKWRPWRELGK